MIVYDEIIAPMPDGEASHDSKQYGIYNLLNGRTVYSKSGSKFVQHNVFELEH